MKPEHWDENVRPKLATMDFDELIELRDELQADSNAIKASIDRTRAKRSRNAEDRKWLVRANSAVRFHGRCIQIVQAELGRLRDESKAERHAASMDYEKRKLAIFVSLVRKRFGDDATNSIWLEVDAEMSAAAQNGGARG